MIGRNDPCLCGSGKKYKKCCALKNEQSTDQLVEEELDRVIVSYYENAFKSYADVAEIEQYGREWNNKLGKYMSREDIDDIVTEYFLFVVRRDLWSRHLLKILNGPLRTATRTVLESWHHPIVLFGKVKEIHEDHFLVDEVLGHHTYSIKLEEGMRVNEGLLTFAVVLPDNRQRENGLYLFGGLIFIPDHNGAFSQQIESMAEASGQTSSYEFFKHHLLDIHRAIVERDVNSIGDLVQRELTPIQQEVITLLVEELTAFDAPVQVLEIGQMIAVDYLLMKKPTFRKPSIIAAAVFKAMYDFGVLGPNDFSQTEIADLFGVSVGSMMKHRDLLEEILEEIAEKISDGMHNDSSTSYLIGSDPWMTERVNWEMYCKMAEMDFETIEEAQAYMNTAVNTKFIPKGKKQRAQVMAYDAYEAQDAGEKMRLASAAYATDPENVDAVLLQADLTGSQKEAEQFYQTAIRLGEGQFDDEPEIPWGLVTNRPYMRAIFCYGIWLYENARPSEAAKYFQQLLDMNPDDHQGARYPAMASFIQAGEYASAAALLDKYEKRSSNEAPYLYLKWLLEMERTNGKTKAAVKLFEEACEANPYIEAMVEEDLPKLPLPKQLEVVSGSIEEALYIWFLL